MGKNIPPSRTDSHISRRDFLKLAKIAGLSMLTAYTAGLYISQIEPGWLDVTQVQLALPRLPAKLSGLRIVQISDLHLSSWMTIQRLTHVFDTIRALQPNLVAITGDLVVGFGQQMTSPQELVELEAPLKSLAAEFPIFAVLGNHDHYFGTLQIIDVLERSGVRTLANDIQRINIGQEVIYFAGVDDVMVKKDRIDDILPKLPDDACTILMVHEPDFADQSAATGRFDLQISGHSHGGQVNIPFLGAPYFPDLAKKYPQGLYRVGKMYQYTNRGVGMSPPFVRFNCRPEVTVFNLFSV